MSDDIEAKLRAAEAAVAEMSENFTEWIGDDMKKAETALRFSKEDLENCAEAMADFYNSMHNIKGLGGSFGYDLVTSIADSCCILLKKTEVRNSAVLKVCQAHFSALDAIIAKNVKGDGGETGAEIMIQLRESVNKTIAAAAK